MKVFKPCNYIPYIKKDVENFLYKEYGWKKFQHKHHESRFTRFYEDFWLIKKFGFDKRKAHFSSLILTGQMTRNDALIRLKKPEMTEEFIKNEFQYISNKLALSVEELENIFKGKNKTYKDYKNKKWIIELGTKVLRATGLEKRLFR